MLSEFENFVKKEQLFTKKSRLLLAISGGADSVCLFHLLRLGNYRFELAHCNFGLRGAESDADEAFVKTLAVRYKIPLHTKRFETKQASVRLKKGTQETARMLRYSWFEELRIQGGFECVLTAHHLTDNTETMLINLLRSTGISGLHGIPKQNGYIVRPMLFAGRAHIDAFIKRGRFGYRQDASNDSDDYLRNRIRHHLLPHLNALEPHTDVVFKAVANHISAYETMSEELLRIHIERHSTTDGLAICMDDKAFQGFTEPHVLLYYAIKPYGFNMDAVKAFAVGKQPATGAKIHSSTHSLIRERNGYTLTKLNNAVPEVIRITKTGHYLYNAFRIEFKKVDLNTVDFRKAGVLYFDADKCHFPLLIRQWKAADRMQVLGMKGSKKISDILTDKKVASAMRKSRPVLCAEDGTIMALLPDVCSELYKLHKSTANILAVHIISL